MILVFRVSYHTVPGESQRLAFSLRDPISGLTMRQDVPMRWLDAEHWEAEIRVDAGNPVDIEYHYQYRDERNGALLDEWLAPRRASVNPAEHDAHVMLDDWRCAGTVDYALETKAFAPMLAARGPYAAAADAPDATHRLSLHMAAVPAGMRPCVLGGAAALGDWDWQRAIPLTETAPNHWETRLILPADRAVEFKFGLHSAVEGTAVALELGENRVLTPHTRGGRQLTDVRCEAYRRAPSGLPRGAGVAIPVFSLRGDARWASASSPTLCLSPIGRPMPASSSSRSCR